MDLTKISQNFNEMYEELFNNIIKLSQRCWVETNYKSLCPRWG